MAKLNAYPKDKNISFHPRRIARSIAKANMERVGNNHLKYRFSLDWKKWVLRDAKSIKKGRKNK